MKEVLEEVMLLAREATCGEQEDRKNGFYERDRKTPLGTPEDLSIPQTPKKLFTPWTNSSRPWSKEVTPQEA
ncbi:hypothetical protein ACP6EK_05100 [Candidatus Caldatribacterium sp. SIUC1]|uniref:hypothetical protein n=1 Tax=Candidatus Caldatribacterium sp. SIUC1 TaxID=3418365 RepID=UPI003F69482E